MKDKVVRSDPKDAPPGPKTTGPEKVEFLANRTVNLQAAALQRRSPLAKGPLLIDAPGVADEEVPSEEEENGLTFMQTIAQAASLTPAETAAFEAAQARKAEKHAREQKGALEAFQKASRAAPPQQKSKKGGSSRSFSISKLKLGAQNRPKPAFAVPAVKPGAAGGSSKEGPAARGASTLAPAKDKGKAPVIAPKKAPAGTSLLGF